MRDSTGKVYRLPLEHDGKAIYAKDVHKGLISFFLMASENPVEYLSEVNPFYTNGVHVSLPKKGGWVYLGNYEMSEDEKKRVPNLFRQDFSDYNDCFLIVPGKLEPIPTKPEECIGLERRATHDEWQDLKETLLNKLKGIKTPKDELYRLKFPGIDKPVF